MLLISLLQYKIAAITIKAKIIFISSFAFFTRMDFIYHKLGTGLHMMKEWNDLTCGRRGEQKSVEFCIKK